MKTLQNNMNAFGTCRTIRYSDTGIESSPVIIFIHGFPFNKLMWNRQIQPLEEIFRVIAYDILGTGVLDDDTTDFSIDSFVSDLINLMDTLHINKATICGLSLGGFVAVKAIERFPERFESLLISDLNAVGDRQVTKADGISAIESIRINGVNEFNDENLKILFSSESLAINLKEIAMAWKMVVKSATFCHYNTLHSEVLPKRDIKEQRVALIAQ